MRLQFAELVPAMALLLAACGVSTSGHAETASAYRFSETRVPVGDGLHLYARVAGDGPDTVLIPGGMYLASDLQPLAVGRTLIFYDPRGRGASDAVLDPTLLGIDRDLVDMEAVREHFHLDRFALVGWSYLGALVALYAAEHPAHVVRLVQVDPVAPRSETANAYRHPVPPPDSAGLMRLAELRAADLPRHDPVGYCREWLRLELLPGIMAQPQAVRRTSMDPCLYWNEWPDQLFATLARTMPPSWDYTEQAGRVTAPVLTIHGTDDPSAPVEGGREWASLVVNARLLEIEGVGHVPFLEARERFLAEVDAFLAGG